MKQKEKNNFKEIFNHEAPDSVKNTSLHNAESSVKTVKSFFDVLDVYITKFLDAIVHSFSSPQSITGISNNLGEEEEETADQTKK